MDRACADLARAFDVPIHTHVAETKLEVDNCRKQHRTAVVPHIASHGLLETKLLAAHCVHLESSEMYALKEAGAGVAHCPSSNLKLASGIANVGEMLSIGLNVGVGTDGPASNNDLDMVEEVRLAAFLAKTKANDPTVLPARRALELATQRGARAIHMGDVTGSLEVGKRADLAIVAMSGVSQHAPVPQQSRRGLFAADLCRQKWRCTACAVQRPLADEEPRTFNSG